MLRLDGAVDFVSALSVNKTLTYLDLSYNALGKEAGIILGEAILDNRTLQHLKLCHNGIQACACFTICQAIIENIVLKEVSLDGNPIGEQGARALMMIPMFAGNRCRISAIGCNLTIRDSDCGNFNLSNPCGVHELKLDKPFERAKAFAILRVVAQHQTYILGKAAYVDARGGKADNLDLIQIISTEKEGHLPPHLKPRVEQLRNMVSIGTNPREALEVFDILDLDSTSELGSTELHRLFLSIGLNFPMLRVVEIVNSIDVTGGGMVSKDEFKQFLQFQKEVSQVKLKDLVEEPMYALSSAKPTPYSLHARYVPPKSGTLLLTVVDGFSKKKVYRAISSADRDHIYDVAKSSGDAVQMIGYSVQNVRLRLDETLNLYDTIYRECRNKIKTITMLLPYMSDFNEAKIFVSKITDDDRVEFGQIKAGMGQILRPIFGQCDGYYNLDMTKPLDVLCLCRLLEISKTVFMKKQMDCMELFNTTASKHSKHAPPAQVSIASGLRLGDTSQHCNFSCFRNELKDGFPFEITTESCTPLPSRGVLEFDFCIGSFVDLLLATSPSLSAKPTESGDAKHGQSNGNNSKTGKSVAASNAKDSPSKSTKDGNVTETANGPSQSTLNSITPIADRKFLRILQNCCLIRSGEISSLCQRLSAMKRQCDQSIVMDEMTSNGSSTVHEISGEDALVIFNRMNLFYGSLAGRAEEGIKALRKEEVKVNFMAVTISDKEQTAEQKQVNTDFSGLGLGELLEPEIRAKFNANQLPSISIDTGLQPNSDSKMNSPADVPATASRIPQIGSLRRAASVGRKTILRPGLLQKVEDAAK
jgi:hypothetical protein